MTPTGNSRARHRTPCRLTIIYSLSQPFTGADHSIPPSVHHTTQLMFDACLSQYCRLPPPILPSSAWSKALDPNPSSDLVIMALCDPTFRGYVMTMRRRSRIGTSERLKARMALRGLGLEYYWSITVISHPARDARNNLALICCRDTPHTVLSTKTSPTTSTTQLSPPSPWMVVRPQALKYAH
jgi:hypothetical protein